jgi:signal transduction histidine kinase
LAGAGIAVKSERLEDRLPCRIDPGSLRFVIDNLIGNAMESMRMDGGGELVVSAFRNSGLVTVTVTDSGCGIEPANAERIFQAGFTSRPGGGMGLYRSREFLREWGGDITLVRSEPGVGSTFMLRLVSLEEEPR